MRTHNINVIHTKHNLSKITRAASWIFAISWIFILFLCKIPVYAATTAEEAIVEGLQKKQDTINVSPYNLSAKDVNSLYLDILYDHPELYYVQFLAQSTTVDETTNKASISTPYYFTYMDDNKFQQASKKAMQCVTTDMTDLEKIVILHDYLITHCKYDDETEITSHPTNRNAYGALVDGKAVCQGYTLTYKYLLDQAGIESYIAQSANHAWNIVKLDGKYYNVDVTFDDPRIYESKETNGSVESGQPNDVLGYASHSHMLVSESKLRSGSDRDSYTNYTIKGTRDTSKVVTSDTTYDHAFWHNLDTMPNTGVIPAPIIIKNHTMYYLSKGALSDYVKKISSDITGLPDSAGSNVAKLQGERTINSGLSYTQGYLLYNDTKAVYAVKTDGTNGKKLFDADTTNGNVYGSMLANGKIKYQTNLGQTAKILEHDIDLSDSASTEITSLDLNINKLSIKANDTYELSAIATPDNADTSTLEWAVSDPEILSIDAKTGSTSAKIAAKKEGSTTVTVTGGNHQAKCIVTVTSKVMTKTSAPTFSLASGSVVAAGTKIKITAEDGASIYYTTDGSDPTIQSSLYHEELILTKSQTIRAIAIKDGQEDSSIAEASYTVGNESEETKYAAGPSIEHFVLNSKDANNKRKQTECVIGKQASLRYIATLPDDERLDQYGSYCLKVVNATTDGVFVDQISSVKVTCKGQAETTLSEGAYSVSDQTEHGFTITISDLKQYVNDLKNAVVTIDYTVHLGEAAVSTNDANLSKMMTSYSLDSKYTEDKTMYEAPEYQKTVFLFTHKLNLTVYIDTEDPANVMKGVGVRLYSDVSCTKEIPLYQKNGVYYTTNDKDASEEMVTDDNGTICISGLASGSYYVKETTVPDSINPHVTAFTINSTYSVDESITGYSKYGNTYIKSNKYQNVVNVVITQGQGTEVTDNTIKIINAEKSTDHVSMPVTGGTGTAAFYIVGLIAIVMGIVGRKQLFG